MPRSDDLKHRLDELFSSMAPAEPEVQATQPELRLAPAKPSPVPGATESAGDAPLSNAFRGAFETLSVGMILTSLEGRLMKVNDSFCQMLGYERLELEGVNFQRLTHPDDLKVGAEAMRAMLSGATRTARFEKRYIHKDGRVVWVELNITLMMDADGKPSYFTTVALDVTQQHMTAAMLEKRVHELNCLNDIGHMVDGRPEPDKLFSWLVERIPAAFQHPATCMAAVEYGGRVFGKAQAIDSSSKLVNGLRVKGEMVGWLHVAYSEPRHFVDAESALMGAIVSRISGYLESLRLQDELTQRADLMVAIMDATPDWIFVKDREHRFLSVNQSFASALHRDKNDFYGKNDVEMGFPEEAVMGDPDKGIQGYWWDDEQVLQTGEPQTILGEKNYLDGKLHYFDVFKTVVRDGAGQVIGLLGYARDVTEQTSLIAEVRSQAEREQTLREVSTRVRSSSDVDSVLQIAVRELGDILGRKTFIRLNGREQQMQAQLPDYQDHPMGGNGRRSLLEERLTELNPPHKSRGWDAWNAFTEKFPGSTAYVYDRLEVRPLAGRTTSSASVFAAESEAIDATEGVIVFPLCVRGERIGELGVLDDPLNPLSDDERRLIEQISDQVAHSLESAILFEQTHTSLAEARVLYAGSARIIAASNFDGVLNALVETTRLAELDQVGLELFDRPWASAPPQKMVTTAVWSSNTTASVSWMGATRPLAGLPFAHLLNQSAPLVIRDLWLDERIDPVTREEFIEKHGVRGQVFWPLVAGGQWFGVVTGQSANPLTLDQSDIRQIGSLVAHASSTIQSMKLQEDMRLRLQELTSLQRLMSRDAWTAYQAQKSVEAQGYLFDQVELMPVSHSRLKERNGYEDTLQAETGHISMKSGVWTPLEVQGEPIGTLGVDLEPGRTLTDDEEIFLTAVSEQVAQALERARLMEQTQKSAVELQAVAEVGTATATILDPDQLLQEVVDLAKQRFGLYHAHIYLMDDANENLVLAVGAGDVGRSMTAEGWSIPLNHEESLVACAARTRQGQVINDVRLTSGYLPNPILLDTLSEMAVPMVIGDRLLGVFDVQSDQVNRFHDEDVRIYTTLAAQIAVALQNANLYAEQLATVERLRELDNMKSAFLANMSHELRTPLNSILGFTQVVLEGIDGPLTDIMVADLELIEKNGKHLLNLINEVLDMAKIDSGRLSLNPEPLNLYDLMEDVIGTSGPLAREKDLYMNLDANPVEDWEVMADHVRMRQIFLNLIGNAIKFTEAGGITVQLHKLTEEGDNQGELVRLSIQDTGIGVPRNKLDEIFEAFTQVDSSTTRKAGGTGLGLPISRRLVELHGGRLWAESEGAGKGSTFILEMPVGKNEHDDNA